MKRLPILRLLNLITLFLILLFLMIPGRAPATACTSFIITKGASQDGSTIITYTADSHTLYGECYYRPAADYLEGKSLEILDTETGKVLGTIPQVPHTYAVVGYMNERQVAIAETTMEARKELKNPDNMIDYENLIFIALERADSARKAILIMGEIAEKYGFRGDGETFSIADKDEAWVMDIVGRGVKKKGAIWVARKVPDGYVSGHANQSRIRQFPLNDGENCLYAKDVIAFAKEMGYFKGSDEQFSFMDAYAPMSFSGLRACEARVWEMFRRVAPSLNLSIELVKGEGGRKPEPLPLWIKPDKRLSVHDVMDLMRDHFEGTEFDLSNGVGAGPYHLPYRWRPLTWKVDKKEYFNERSTSTQQTAYSFVSQSRSGLPDLIGGMLWFGIDDTASTVYVPIYCGVREIPVALAEGTGTFNEFNWNSAFWVFNFVANFTYSRYSEMIVDIRREQSNLEGSFLARQSSVEDGALALYKQSPELARDYLTAYCAKQSEFTVSRWKKLLTDLLVKFLDGNLRVEKGKVTHPGYPEDWYRRIIKDSGDFYRNRRIEGELPPEQEPTPPPKTPVRH